MLRITVIHDSHGPGLKLEGKLLTAWTDELRIACAELARQTRRPRLDLKQLSYVDSLGAKLLESLQRGGFELVGCSPYISTILQMEAS
jgi:anti-anti-sigma regulatory factor